MDRLTIRNSDGSVSQPTNLRWAEALNRLAAYEDTDLTPMEIKSLLAEWKVNLKCLDSYRKAEAEGRLVILPCKVGDTVYAVFEEQGILSLTVKRFLLSENGLFITTPHGLYHTERFGKTVFLTREEAEKALEAHP